MIILTGGAGFIGTNVLTKLNETGKDDILVVDNINSTTKWQHLVELSYWDYVNKYDFWSWLEEHPDISLQAIIHLGACSDTTEKDFDYLVNNNIRYSQHLWSLCSERNIPFIYASSAATYGAGEQGFFDDHKNLYKLKPINAYGYSKHLFDLWVLQQEKTPLRWAGLKFFNVYGPHEDHKGNMASVVYHAFPQAIEKERIRLFKSHRSDYLDGEQKRDFIYVKDVVKVILHFLNHNSPSGIYNVGTGQPNSFNDLAKAIFNSLEKSSNIEYINMPNELQSRYQYFTKAEIGKLKNICIDFTFTSLTEGVSEYVTFMKNKTD